MQANRVASKGLDFKLRGSSEGSRENSKGWKLRKSLALASRVLGGDSESKRWPVVAAGMERSMRHSSLRIWYYEGQRSHAQMTGGS